MGIATIKNFTAMVACKDAQFETCIDGDLDDLMAGVTFLVCKVCAISGRTAGAREILLDRAIETLGTFGRDILEGLAAEEEEEEADNATE